MLIDFKEFRWIGPVANETEDLVGLHTRRVTVTRIRTYIRSVTEIRYSNGCIMQLIANTYHDQRLIEVNTETLGERTLNLTKKSSIMNITEQVTIDPRPETSLCWIEN